MITWSFMAILPETTYMHLSQEFKSRFADFPPAWLAPWTSTAIVSGSSRLNREWTARGPNAVRRWLIPSLTMVLLLANGGFDRLCNAKAAAYGLVTRPTAKAYLEMPATDHGDLPKLLSQTGAF